MPTIPKVLKTGLSSVMKSTVGRFYRRRAGQVWSLDSESFWNLQNNLFNEIYTFARERTPHYRDHFNDYPELPANLPLLDKLATLPVLEKSTVKSQNKGFWATPRLRLTTFHTTSGTSGTPLRIPSTLWERSKVSAIMSDWYYRICGSARPRTLALSGFLSPEPGSKELYWTDKLGDRMFLSIYAINETNKDQIEKLLSGFRPELIYGYASAVHQLALLFKKKPAPYHSERIAVVTSEVLEPHWRVDIEGSVARNVFNLYGSQEGAAAALECKNRALHIHPTIGIIEIVNQKDQPVSRGESGRVLVTSLLRKSFPLIRYELGDIAESTGYATDCPCGLEWPTVGNIQGRSEDLVKTRDGRNIGYLCFHATKDLQGIKEAQLVQKGYESFIFSIVPSETEPHDRSVIERLIRENLNRRLQAQVSVAFRYPASIERGPNEKFKAVVVDFEDADRRQYTATN